MRKFLNTFGESSLFLSPEGVERVYSLSWGAIRKAAAEGRITIFSVGKRRLVRSTDVEKLITTSPSAREVVK